MRYVRMVGLCLAASVALVACTATAASAKLPEWGQCEATESGTGGRYADAACTQPLKKIYGKNGIYPGGYEWYPLAEASKLEYGQDSKLKYTTNAFESGIPQPVSETTITFANGHEISCGALQTETLIVLTGAHTTTIAPDLTFDGCVDDTSHGECHTLDSRVPGEITISKAAWENGEEKAEGYTEYGPSWNGAMTYIEGKQTSQPVVGMVYKTQEKGQPFMQQLVCEGAELHAAEIGGHKTGEELTLSITPVNTMSPSFTAGFRQSEGRQLPTSFEGRTAKPVEALVNAERWETVGFETTMLFPTELYVAPVNHNDNREELELKATP